MQHCVTLLIITNHHYSLVFKKKLTQLVAVQVNVCITYVCYSVSTMQIYTLSEQWRLHECEKRIYLQMYREFQWKNMPE